MVKAIIFDCFGVLVGRGFEYTYRLAGGDPAKDKAFIDATLNQSNFGLISDVAFREVMAKQLGITVEQWRAAVMESEQPDKELLSYIKDLRKRYKTAVLSNANKGSVDRKIGQPWLADCFDEVIVSADVGLVKPDPRIYELTIKRLGVEPSECVFIDDIQAFIEASRQLGMKGILYQNFAQLKHELATALN